MQQEFNLSDPAMEEALYDIHSMRPFAQLPGGRVPDEMTILNLRHLLEKNNVAEEMFEGVNLLLQDYGLMVHRGTIVDATIIDAPSSTKNAAGQCDPEMHQTKKGNNYFFGMKAHIGVDLHSGLVHTVMGTADNVADVTQVAKLLHGDEEPGYQGMYKCPEHEGREVAWHIVLSPSLLKETGKAAQALRLPYERNLSSLRVKVEHPFRVLKRQFGHTKVRYKGLAKNTAQLLTLFTLGNLWMERHPLMQIKGQVRPWWGNRPQGELYAATWRKMRLFRQVAAL